MTSNPHCLLIPQPGQCHLSPGPSSISSMASLPHRLPSFTCHPVRFLKQRGQTVLPLASQTALPHNAWPSKPFYHFLCLPHVCWPHFPCYPMSASLYCSTSLSQEAPPGGAKFYSWEKAQLPSTSSVNLSGKLGVSFPNPKLKALQASSTVPMTDPYVWC